MINIELTHFYINLTFRMLVNIHFQKWPLHFFDKPFLRLYDSDKGSGTERVIYKASCWDCNDFYIGKTKRRLHDRKTEHFKALVKNDHTSAIADHVKTTGHNIKWDHFDILASGKTDCHCRVTMPTNFEITGISFCSLVSDEKVYSKCFSLASPGLAVKLW